MSNSPVLSLSQRIFILTSLAAVTSCPVAVHAFSSSPSADSFGQAGVGQRQSAKSWLLADKKDNKDDKKGRDDDRGVRIDLTRAKNLARQAAEEANGGIRVYRAEDSMHGPAKQAPHVDHGDSWTFTFLGGRPTATPTIESVVTVYKATSRVVVEYNGAVRTVRQTSMGQWKGALKLARLVSQNALVLQLDVLDKPVTDAATVAYEIFARRKNQWVSVYRSAATQLVATAGQTRLSPVVIPLNQLQLGNMDISSLDLRTVAQVSYRGQQTVLQEVTQRYQGLRQISSAQQINTTSTSTTTGSTTTTGAVSTSARQTITLSNGYRVTFLDVSYSGTTSTWRYSVEELPVAQDLSNWVLGLPACAQVVSASPKGERVNPDPNARISGIKWQPGGGFQQGEFSVTLNGRLAVGTINVAVKGPDVARGTISGPSCNSL